MAQRVRVLDSRHELACRLALRGEPVRRLQEECVVGSWYTGDIVGVLTKVDKLHIYRLGERSHLSFEGASTDTSSSLNKTDCTHSSLHTRTRCSHTCSRSQQHQQCVKVQQQSLLLGEALVHVVLPPRRA